MIFDYEPADPVFLPLMSSTWCPVIILAVYLYFVLKLGQDWMEFRKPYNVQKAMLIYNAVQIGFNTVLFGLTFWYMFVSPIYDLRCIESLPIDNPNKIIERAVTYMYYLNKVLDLMDTIFFVVRKSFKQITTLHVYHHCLMVMFTHGTFMGYGAGGQYAVIALLNSLVHMVMYSYYLFTALYPGSKGSLWWKKYITIMQLAQFTLIALQSLWVLIFNSSCQFPLIMHFIQLSQAGVMMAMFGNFYAKAYCGKKKIEAKSKKIDN